MSRERAILAGARVFFNNAAIKIEQVKLVAADAPSPPDQVLGFLVDPGCTVMVPARLDRRGQPPSPPPARWGKRMDAP